MYYCEIHLKYFHTFNLIKIFLTYNICINQTLYRNFLYAINNQENNLVLFIPSLHYISSPPSSGTSELRLQSVLKQYDNPCVGSLLSVGLSFPYTAYFCQSSCIQNTTMVHQSSMLKINNLLSLEIVRFVFNAPHSLNH